MKSIAIFNNKGGVGKTTLVANLAAFLAKRKQKRILLIDADPQCNATQAMLSEREVENLYDTTPATKRETIWQVTQPTRAGRGFASSLPRRPVDNFKIDLLPGDPRLSLVEDVLSADWISATGGQVRGMRTTLMFAKLLEKASEYDFVFFDMGPSLGGLNRSVLLACNYFIVPTSIDIFSLQAIKNMASALVQWRKRLNRGLGDLDDPDDLQVEYAGWQLHMLGYVTQQYIYRKDVFGKPRAVKAYDRLLRRVPVVVKKEMLERYEGLPDVPAESYQLGTIPYFHSLIPLSQQSRNPIFALTGRDGVVGAHFTKVQEFEDVIEEIASNLSRRAQEVCQE